MQGRWKKPKQGITLDTTKKKQKNWNNGGPNEALYIYCNEKEKYNETFCIKVNVLFKIYIRNKIYDTFFFFFLFSLTNSLFSFGFFSIASYKSHHPVLELFCSCLLVTLWTPCDKSKHIHCIKLQVVSVYGMMRCGLVWCRQPISGTLHQGNDHCIPKRSRHPCCFVNRRSGSLYIPTYFFFLLSFFRCFRSGSHHYFSVTFSTWLVLALWGKIDKRKSDYGNNNNNNSNGHDDSGNVDGNKKKEEEKETQNGIQQQKWWRGWRG